jgi:hypothetical protein
MSTTKQIPRSIFVASVSPESQHHDGFAVFFGEVCVLYDFEAVIDAGGDFPLHLANFTRSVPKNGNIHGGHG